MEINGTKDMSASADVDNPAKKPKLEVGHSSTSDKQDIQKLVPNRALSETELVNQWKTAWNSGLQFEGDQIKC